MEQRFRAVQMFCAAGAVAGVPVFSPIVHWHHAASVHGMPTDAEFWWNYNRQMMVDSDGVVFFLLGGWEQSKGIHMEHAFCHEHGIPFVQVALARDPFAPGAYDQSLKDWGLIAPELSKLMRKRKPARALDRN